VCPSLLHGCSALKKADGTFAPAYILADGRLERAGRATQKVQHTWGPASSSMGGSASCGVGNSDSSSSTGDCSHLMPPHTKSHL